MSLLEAVRARVHGDFEVDAWGLDPEVHDSAVALGRLRWGVEMMGTRHIPDAGPALFVLQRRVGISEQAVFAVGVASNTDRRVVSAGIPGVRVAEGPLRRLGGALAHPAEVAGLVRDGHLVSTGSGWSPIHDSIGPVSADVLAGPIELNAPVVPVAMRGREWGRRWRVLIGPPLADLPTAGGADTRATAIEAAATVRAALAELSARLREH